MIQDIFFFRCVLFHLGKLRTAQEVSLFMKLYDFDDNINKKSLRMHT